MNKSATQLVELDIKDLVKADWNYKSDATPELLDKLCQSISRDKSAGVLAVRELEGNKFEVIDGNHRYEAVFELAWEKVPCENFGDISLAQAVTIARRRNHQWFEDDLFAYGELFREIVLPEYGIEELASFMPETQEEMKNLENMLDFDWAQFDREPDPELGLDHKGEQELKLYFDSEMMLEMVNAELDRISNESGRSRSEALCLAIAGSASFSVEELTEKYVNVLSVSISTDTESADLTEAVF